MRRRPGYSDPAERKQQRGFEQYKAPLEVPQSYSMDDYPWDETFIRDQFTRECNGNGEVARTVREMLELGLWFERDGDTVTLIGEVESDDLVRRMQEHRVGIRRWYLENVHGDREAA